MKLLLQVAKCVQDQGLTNEDANGHILEIENDPDREIERIEEKIEIGSMKAMEMRK